MDVAPTAGRREGSFCLSLHAATADTVATNQDRLLLPARSPHWYRCDVSEYCCISVGESCCGTEQSTAVPALRVRGGGVQACIGAVQGNRRQF